MKAMILAAGIGTRLRPLTDNRPKALVTIAGRTLLEVTLRRLRALGVCEAIVNVHHHAGMIVDYLRAHNNFGMRIEISREEHLLDTGGGLKNAAFFFLEPGPDLGQPFILHNVDVVSNIDLRAMVSFHSKCGALATLAVQNRKSSRLLLFNNSSQLCGRRIARSSPAAGQGAIELENQIARPCADAAALAFSGIHVISPQIFAAMQEVSAFSIIDAYLDLAAREEKVVGFRADDSYWRDLGRPESLLAAENDLVSGRYPEVFGSSVEGGTV